MIQMLYIVIGVLFIFAVSLYIITMCIAWGLELFDKIRNPIIDYNTIKQYEQLALAFHEDKKLSHIFKTLAENQVWGRGIDVWKFRDEMITRFGR